MFAGGAVFSNSWWVGMAGIRRSLLLASAERYASPLINIATVVITARLLTPADIGVTVLGSIVVRLANSRVSSAPRRT